MKLSAREQRKLDAEARHMAVVLDDDDLSGSAAFQNMKQESLSLKEPPIKGDPDKEQLLPDQPAMSRSLQRRVAVMKGEEIPTFSDPDNPLKADSKEQPMAAPLGPFKCVLCGGRGLLYEYLEGRASAQSKCPDCDGRGILESKMAATPALMNESRAKELAAPLMPVADQFTLAIKRLDALPLTKQTVETAKELDVEAITYIEKVKGSELRKQADAANNVHRFLTGMLSRLLDPAAALRKRCSRIFGDFERQELARVAEERRQREEAIRKQQEEERRAEEATLKERIETMGEFSSNEAKLELEVLQQTPMPVVAAPAAKEEVKIQGVSLVYSAKLTRIKDPAAFTKWLVDHPEHIMGFEIKAAYWKALLTAHLEKETGFLSMVIPGAEFEITSSSRHTKND